MLLVERYMGDLSNGLLCMSKVKLPDSKVIEYIEMLLPMDNHLSAATETGLYLESSAYVYGIFQDERNFGNLIQTEV